jgi:hypothetical protein
LLTLIEKKQVILSQSIEMPDSELQRTFYMQGNKIAGKEFNADLIITMQVLRRQGYDGYNVYVLGSSYTCQGFQSCRLAGSGSALFGVKIETRS